MNCGIEQKTGTGNSDDSEIEYEHRIESGQDIEFLGAQVNLKCNTVTECLYKHCHRV